MTLTTMLTTAALTAALAGGVAVGAVTVLTTSGPAANRGEPASARLAETPPLAPPVTLARLSTLSGDPSRKGPFQGGSTSVAGYGTPDGVAVAPDGTVFVADYDNHVVVRIDVSGRASRFAGSGIQGTTDGPSDRAEFFGPSQLALGADGTLYVADGYGNRVRKIDSHGNVATVAGGGPIGLGKGSFADGTGPDARFDGVSALVVEKSGDVLVADYANQRIRRVSQSGVVTTLAGDGTVGHRDGPTAQATFHFPSALALSPDGSLVVAEHGNNDVRRIDATGQVTTLVLSGRPLADGGLFSYPSGVAVASDGTVYLADTQSNRILRLGEGGKIEVVVGSSSPGFIDGVGGAARLNSPGQIAFSSAGDLVVADMGNAAVRKVTSK